MKRHSIQLALALVALSTIPCLAAGERPKTQTPTGFAWKQTDDSLALTHDNHVVWQSNHRRGIGKPCLHPVGLIDGTRLTWFRPADHPWHRAVWFAWKKINGTIYWEEGKDGLSPGRNEVVRVEVKTHDDHSARIEIDLTYHLPEAPPVLRENRVIEFSSPGPDGSYSIDWTGTFTAGKEDVVFDRTSIPGEPGGVGHGGYAGLSVRMAEETRSWKAVNDRGTTDDQCNGKSARWMRVTGTTASGQKAGVAILDHPANLRHPSPWYVTKGMPYYSPAVLFRAPYTLPAGKSLTLRYRILIDAEAADTDRGERRRMKEAWESFIEG